MADQIRPVVYLKRTCPFCLKLRIFLTEAGLTQTVDFVVFDQDDDLHRRLRTRMEEEGHEPSFPVVSFDGETLETDSDELIARFAERAGVDAGQLPLLRYYEEGVFPCYLEMHGKLAA